MMNSQPHVSLSSANMVNQPFSNPQRTKKVRSSNRKRGSRGKGKSRKANNAGEGSNPQQQQQPSQQDVAMMETPTKQKRRRERKNRKWKPYSAMTWQEKLEQEKKESIKAELTDNPFDVPAGRRKRRRKSTEINMPRAPRNTTQSLIHADSTDYERSTLDLERRVIIPSMQGILSRETLKNGRNFDSHEESSDDDSQVDLPYVLVSAWMKCLPLRAVLEVLEVFLSALRTKGASSRNVFDVIRDSDDADAAGRRTLHTQTRSGRETGKYLSCASLSVDYDMLQTHR
eukprot:767000-Hanusia_phi.AAC.2